MSRFKCYYKPEISTLYLPDIGEDVTTYIRSHCADYSQRSQDHLLIAGIIHLVRFEIVSANGTTSISSG